MSSENFFDIYILRISPVNKEGYPHPMRFIKLGHLAELKRWWSKRAGFCALALAAHWLVFTSPIPSYSASKETLKATIVYHLGNAMSVADAEQVLAGARLEEVVEREFARQPLGTGDGGRICRCQTE